MALPSSAIINPILNSCSNTCADAGTATLLLAIKYPLKHPLTDKNGTGLKITGTIPLEFSSLHYSINDFDPGQELKQYHAGELERRSEIYLNVDHRQMGVAGIDSWYSLPLEQYRVYYDNYQYSYVIKPIN